MYMLDRETVPEHLVWDGTDPAFGAHKVLFRRVSNQVCLTIFEGGHELYERAALEWLSRQVKGTQADWNAGSAASANGVGTAELSK